MSSNKKKQKTTIMERGRNHHDISGGVERTKIPLEDPKDLDDVMDFVVSLKPQMYIADYTYKTVLVLNWLMDVRYQSIIAWVVHILKTSSRDMSLKDHFQALDLYTKTLKLHDTIIAECA